MERIWFDRPAEKWEEALPIGNGKLGAMVFGGIQKERIALNQDSIWYGGPIDRINPDAKSHLDEVRKLILAGKIPEAERVLRYSFSGTPQSERPYQPLGNVELTFYEDGYQKPEKKEDNADGYRRELNLEEALVQEEYRVGKTRIQKEYLASFPHGVIAVHMKAEEGTISLDALLRRERFYDHAGKLDEKTIYMDCCLGKGGVSFLAALRAEHTGGEVQVLGEHLLVRAAKELTLYLSCETTFYENDPEEAVKNRLDEASRDGYEKVKAAHIADYQTLYGRVTLEISGEDARLPLPERMKKGKENGFDGAFAALYFQYGRYLLISSSRPGSLPANLQGIWNEDMQPSWDSKYTININTEMNYWPAEICGLAECHLPLFDHLCRMWENGKKTAREMYGCRGFVAHHNTDLWGDCAPQDIYIPATYWVMGGAWLCTHIWTHYLYTGDTAFLRQMYPIMKDAVLFFHDFLIEVNGELVTCPSVSPENTYILPDGTRGCVCEGSTMDTEILRDLLEDYIKASELLEAGDETVEKSKEILEKLPKLKIGKYGQIMEWREDYEELEPGHRHISQLYALHPSHRITVDKTPKLAEAAEKTLERRLAYGGGHTGWSCAWIVNFYGRLGNGEAAWQNLKKLWSVSTFPNLMDNHPRKDGYVFQIDGNFGATAAIAEMLVQSDEDRILLLPALPKQWTDGKLTGLVVCGGATIDLEWKNGSLTACCMRAARRSEMKVVYRGKAKTITLEAGASTCVNF